jgi:hypothetical protein
MLRFHRDIRGVKLTVSHNFGKPLWNMRLRSYGISGYEINISHPDRFRNGMGGL